YTNSHATGQSVRSPRGFRMKRDNEPMLELVNGDIGMSRHLSNALKILAENTADKQLRKQLEEIRSGTGNLRDLAQSDSFSRLGDAFMPAIAEDIAKKSPEEMQHLARAGEALLESYRREEPE